MRIKDLVPDMTNFRSDQYRSIKPWRQTNVGARLDAGATCSVMRRTASPSVGGMYDAFVRVLGCSGLPSLPTASGRFLLRVAVLMQASGGSKILLTPSQKDLGSVEHAFNACTGSATRS